MTAKWGRLHADKYVIKATESETKHQHQHQHVNIVFIVYGAVDWL